MPRFIRSKPRVRLLLQGLEQRTTPNTYTVLNADDSGAGTLRQAITDANINAGSDSINFDSSFFSTPRTISLLSALPSIIGDTTVTGPGSSLLTVEKSDSAGINFRIFAIGNNAVSPTVSMSGMKVTKGYCDALNQTDNGGGILVGKSSIVTLTDLVVSNNQSTAQGGGIAVREQGRLTLINCTVTGNAALGLEYGSPSEAGFTGVGGGVYFTLDGNLTVQSSTIDNNTATVCGAGIFLYGESSGTALIRNSTISSNKVTTSYSGFIYDGGGGGIAVLNNSFSGGSGLFALTVQNSTITANQAAGVGQGGGIQASSLFTNRITTRIESSIIAGNLSGNGPDIYASGQKVTVDFSAIGSTTGFTLTAGPGGAGSNLINQSFPLDPLANNGGPTRTHMVPAGSLLLDKGSNPLPGLPTDQRGLARTFDDPGASGTGIIDIGSVERQPAGLPTALASAPDVISSGASNETITVVYSDDTGINAATIGSGDITVTGPNGYSKTGTLIGTTGSGKSITATYTVPPPGGSWDSADWGTYTISMVAGQVTDTGANAIPAGPVGSFKALFARTLIVNTANDAVSAADGKTSLREAIIDANNFGPTNDTITFDATVFGVTDTIFYSLGQMFITDSVTIQGLGMTKMSLDAGSASRHFNIDGEGVLNVTITGMTLTGGRTSQELQSERGGSIYVNGENLTMDSVRMNANTAQKSYGGAIHLQGAASLTFKNGQLSSNSSPVYAGGAISALDDGHSITILDSKLIGNTGGYYGGAIFSSGGGKVVIDRSTISNNSTTLALADDQGGTVIRGGGGAVMVANGKVVNGSVVEDWPSISTLTVTNSHFDNNSTAVSGGAVLFNGNTTGVVFRNSTFTNNKTGNSQDNVGGAILVGNLQSNPVTIDNCTIAYNSAYSGGGLFVENDNVASVKATSTIFALNSSADPTQLPPDVDGNMTANYCFFGVVEGVGLDASSANNVGNGSLASPVDPGLDFLNANGGPTQTLALLPGSPCLDTGSNPNNELYDQRGVGYNRKSGTAVDIGAFELQVVTAPTITNVKFDDGTAQRSLVRSITVTFNTLVDLPANIADAFSLYRTGPGLPNDFVGLSVTLNNTPTQTVAVITFNAGPLVQSTSLIDGNYEFKVLASQVSAGGLQLDGNGDGTGGDDRVESTFRLFGDSNGDRSVTSVDFAAFRSVFGLTGPSMFDFNGDGVTNSNDFAAFRARFGLTIVP